MAKSRIHEKHDQSIMVFVCWSWLIENQPGFGTECLLGSEHNWASLLSRPIKLQENEEVLIKETQGSHKLVQVVFERVTAPKM